MFKTDTWHSAVHHALVTVAALISHGSPVSELKNILFYSTGKQVSTLYLGLNCDIDFSDKYVARESRHQYRS